MGPPTVIVISGTVGSGKSLLADSLGTLLRWRSCAVGRYAMAVCEQRYQALTIEDCGFVDRMVRGWAREGNVIIDGVFAPLVLRDSPHTKVCLLLTAGFETRVRRLSKRSESRGIDDIAGYVVERDRWEDAMSQEVYKSSYRSPFLYDAVLDTTGVAPRAVLHQALQVLTLRGAPCRGVRDGRRAAARWAMTEPHRRPREP